MRLAELNIGLMAAPQGYYLINPISHDFISHDFISHDPNVESGISATIERQYGLKKKLVYYYNGDLDPGEIYLVDNVYSIVVKNRHDEDLDLEMFMDAISQVREDMGYRMVNRLAIPRIYFEDDENDKKWNEIVSAIKDEFEETDFDILICDL